MGNYVNSQLKLFFINKHFHEKGTKPEKGDMLMSVTKMDYSKLICQYKSKTKILLELSETSNLSFFMQAKKFDYYTRI